MKALRWTVLGAVLALLTIAPMRGGAESLGQSGLDWRQRFLGILPLVKANPADPVVATVNGTQITLAQVNSFAKTEARLINATSTEENKAAWKDALENLVNRQVLIDEAKKRKIAVPDQEVAGRAREFQLTDTRGGQAESGSNAPDPQLLSEVRESMQIESMLDSEFKQHHAAPTDKQIEAYYNSHKDLFTSDPGEVRIAHIAIKLPPNATDAQKNAVKERIAKVYHEAEKTKDFAALAKAKSEDPNSAPKGGDLGFFRPGQLPPVVEKQAFTTPVGKLSDVLASNIGYSFMKITDRRGATYLPFKDVKSKIALVLQSYKQDDVVKGLVRKLRKEAKIEVKPPPASNT
jgi:parvulin-like peptidyl-prolyl isomerase